MNMEKVILNRQELYNLVWHEPLSRLAKKYKISDNGLRKICKRMNIPLPVLGHWQKVQYGKPVKVIKLPIDYTGKNEIILEEKGSDAVDSNSPLIILRRLSKEIEGDPKLPLKVPEKLTKPDKLITSTINYNHAIRQYFRNNQGVFPERIGVLNIEVSDESRPRAYRVMDTILKNLKARNHDIKTHDHGTFAVIEGEEIKFRLREKQRASETKDKWGGRQYEKTGELVFVIDLGSYDRKEIKDGVDSIENKISTIVATLELEGKRKKEERIAYELHRKEEERQQKIREEFRQRQEKEAQAFQDIFLQATRLHQANILRDYIKTVEANAIKNGNLHEKLINWIEWAKQKVEWYDPLINKKDSLLDDSHKASFFRDFLKSDDFNWF
jgi:hypothetical protein